MVPRVGDRDVDVTDDEDDTPLSAMMTPVTQPASLVPTWIDSPEQRIVAGSGWSAPQVIRDRGLTLFDMTEANTDNHDGFVFDPVDTDDELSDTLIDALQEDLDCKRTRSLSLSLSLCLCVSLPLCLSVCASLSLSLLTVRLSLCLETMHCILTVEM